MHERASAPHTRRVTLTRANPEEERDDAAGEQDGAEPVQAEATQQPSSPLPREEDPPFSARPPHHHSTNWFIWMSGMRIAIAMNPTIAPITTMMIGSSRLVSVATLVST